jgi:hypothetical protein
MHRSQLTLPKSFKNQTNPDLTMIFPGLRLEQASRPRGEQTLKGIARRTPEVVHHTGPTLNNIQLIIESKASPSAHFARPSATNRQKKTEIRNVPYVKPSPRLHPNADLAAGNRLSIAVM